LTRRTGDLQWKILHDAVAGNAFVSILNTGVASTCLFCSSRETSFHASMNCCRLQPLFFESDVLQICEGKKEIYQLLNFVLSQAKLVI